MAARDLKLYELLNNKTRDSVTILAQNPNHALQLVYADYVKSMNKDYPMYNVEWKMKHPVSMELAYVVSTKEFYYISERLFKDSHTLFEFKLGNNPEIVDIKTPKEEDIPLIDLWIGIRDDMYIRGMKNIETTNREDELKLYALVDLTMAHIVITAYTPEQAIDILYTYDDEKARKANYALRKDPEKQHFLYNLWNTIDNIALHKYFLYDLWNTRDNKVTHLDEPPVSELDYNDRYKLIEFKMKEGVLFEIRTFSRIGNYTEKKIEISVYGNRLDPIPLQSLIDRRAVHRKLKSPPVSKSKIQKKYQKMKYAPGGYVYEAHKLWLEKCTDAMMKFTKEELLQAARRVGADVTFKMTKEEICNAINDIYFQPESVQPEVQGPQPLGGGWVGSRDELPETLAQIKYQPGGKKELAQSTWFEYCHTEEFSKQTKANLLEIAKYLGIDIWEKATKQEICQSIRDFFSYQELPEESAKKKKSVGKRLTKK